MKHAKLPWEEKTSAVPVADVLLADPMGHPLNPHTCPARSAEQPPFLCSNCQRKVEPGALLQGCLQCVYFVCNKCVVKSSRRGGGRFPPRNKAEELVLSPDERIKA